MHSMASLYPRAAPECVSMVCHRTWRACSGSFRKRKKNVINVAFECIRCIYIYKADHPRCKFIGLRFLSCFFLSKKKVSTEGAKILTWGLDVGRVRYSRSTCHMTLAHVWHMFAADCRNGIGVRPQCVGSKLGDHPCNGH